MFLENASGQKQAPPDGFSVWQCKGNIKKQRHQMILSRCYKFATKIVDILILLSAFMYHIIYFMLQNATT